MIGSKKYSLSKDAESYYEDVVRKINETKYPHLTNPCGEISLHAKGGYCCISDIVPFFCNSLEEVKKIGAMAARFLVRVNMMDSFYHEEVKRTNRIGVCMTGIHEFAWKFFNYGFYDLIDEARSQDFWNFIAELRMTVETAADEYSDLVGMARPHTKTALKPSGSVSKLFALSEGAHLIKSRYYLRWVQFQNNDPLLEKYRKEGYPVRELKSYPNVSIVGFPTRPLIASLGMGDKLVTAYEASPEDQYKWLMLLEKYWLGEGKNNQVSYTLKVNPKKVNLKHFRETLLEYQSKIRCCSVLFESDQEEIISKYEYSPEEDISEIEFNEIINRVNKNKHIDVAFDESELICSSGACPL